MSSVASITAGLTPEQLLLLKDQNHDTQVYVYAIVFTVLTIIATVIRVTSRHMKNVAVGVDDVLIILALVWKPLFHYVTRSNAELNILTVGDYYSTNDIYLRR